jgi:membrane-associated protease RseP (regulator of RpoE activity)
MKTKIILTTAIAALLPLAAFGQASSPDAAPSQPPIPPQPRVAPAPPAPPPHHFMHHDDQPKEPVTFLGIETSDVPRVLSEQLGLPRGFGVVVDYVVPDSAAAAAGLQASDIIRMVNDQIIVEPDQLGKLIRSFPEGTTVNLTLLRKGKEVKVSAKLQKHESKSSQGPFGFEKEWKFDNMGGLEDFHLPDMTSVREAVARAKKEALRAGDEARRAMRNLHIVTTDDGTVQATHVDLGKAQIVFSDEKGELKLESVDGKKVLTAKDPNGKVLFSGPVDTTEERDKVPAEIRQRFENLEKQDLPPVPPAPDIAPRAPEPEESVRLRNEKTERACFSPNNRTGWVRSTVML